MGLYVSECYGLDPCIRYIKLLFGRTSVLIKATGFTLLTVDSCSSLIVSWMRLCRLLTGPRAAQLGLPPDAMAAHAIFYLHGSTADQHP